MNLFEKGKNLFHLKADEKVTYSYKKDDHFSASKQIFTGALRPVHLHHQEVHRNADRQAVHRENTELHRRIFLCGLERNASCDHSKQGFNIPDEQIC